MDTAPGCDGFDVFFGILGLSALTMKLRITASSIVRISSDVFQQTGDFCYINGSKLPNPPPKFDRRP